MAAKFFGQFLLERGLISKEQLLRALEIQRLSNPMLGEIAQARGWLDAAQARAINERQKREDARFGDIAISMGLLSAEQIDALLGQQKALRKLFGEILVEENMLTREQLEAELQAQQADRADALQSLETGMTGHPLTRMVQGSIATCSKLFPRLLKTQCQFANLIESADALDAYPISATVRVSSERPLLIAVACDASTMQAFGGAFLSMPADKCDDELSRDALGELVNVLMGYVVKDNLAEDARYRAAPPDFGTSAPALLKDTSGAVAVAMTSQLGPFALILAG